MSYGDLENPFEDLENPFDPPQPSVASTLAGPAVAILTANPATYYEGQIAAVKAELAPFESKISALIYQATALEVRDSETESQALKLGLPLDRLYKDLEKRRKEIVDAPNAYVKSVNSLAKFFMDQIDQGRQAIKNKLAVYAKAKALEAQKAAETERQVRADMQAKLDAEAARLNAQRGEGAPPIEAPKLPEAPPAAPPKTVRSEEGTATEVKTWAFKVVDPAAIPRDYLAVDEKAIRKAVKDGIREIPGVEIYEDTNIRFGR